MISAMLYQRFAAIIYWRQDVTADKFKQSSKIEVNTKHNGLKAPLKGGKKIQKPGTALVWGLPQTDPEHP